MGSEMCIRDRGESGAKARPKGVVDAQLVDIPVTTVFASSPRVATWGLSFETISPSGWRVADGERRRIGEPGRW